MSQERSKLTGEVPDGDLVRLSGPRGEEFRVCREFAGGADLLELLLDPVAAGALELKRNPRRAVHLLETPAGPLVVKQYAAGRVADRLKSVVGGGRAGREWAIARALSAAGLPVAEPVALGLRRRRGVVDFAVFAARAVPHAVPLGGFLEARYRPGDGRTAEKRVWLERAVELLAALHRAGFDHRDFHGGNLLVAGGATDDPGGLVVVDLHRVVRSRRIRVLSRVDALANLLHTLRFAVSAARNAGFAATAYAVAAGLDSVDPRRLERSVLRRIDRRERRRQRSRTRRCVRDSSRFTPVQCGGVRGYRRRDVAETDLFAAVDQARRAIATGAAEVRSIARRSSVAVARAAGVRVAVKIYEGDGFRRSLRGRWRRGRAGRAYIAAHGLDVRGVAVPGVVAWLQTPDRSFLVVDEVADAIPLSTLSFRLVRGGDLESCAPAVAVAVAELLAAVFSCGGQVNDLSPKNILIRLEAGRARAFLCDFDGVSFQRPAPPDRVIRGLSQVNDLAPALSARLRLRVLRLLRQALPELRGRGRAREIARLTGRRAAKTLGTAAPEAIPGGVVE